MPNPATGLPVVAMPSTTRLVHSSSMPMTTTAATFGLRTGADQGPEMQIQVRAELQPAIRMRKRHAALDIVGYGFRCGVGEIVQGKNNDMVAYAYAPVLAPITPKSRIVRSKLKFLSFVLPTFGFQIVHMHMLACRNRAPPCGRYRRHI